MEDIDEQFAKLFEMFGKEEDLHVDLAPYLCDGPMGQMLHHPLIINVIHRPHDNARTNAFYNQKIVSLNKARDENDWGSFVFLHERPYRLDALKEAICNGLEDDPKRYWDLVSSAWIDSENIHEFYHDWIDLWTADIADRSLVMDNEENSALAALPNVIHVYRGVTHMDAVEGLSWSTNRDKAIWFAKRYSGTAGKTPHLVAGMIARQDVFAHFLGRGEFEIVAMPENVMDQTIIQLE